MSELHATLIDVGWGDSIFLESIDANGKSHYALVDSNDLAVPEKGRDISQASMLYVKKFFQRNKINVPANRPNFHFTMLSHFHTDHGQGLKQMMKYFGTKHFWYPKCHDPGNLAYLFEYSNRSSRVKHHQSIDHSKKFLKFGDADMKLLWPRHDDPPSKDENDNSLVLAITLDDITFLLTGDAEKPVWNAIKDEIPSTTRFFKVPHHGSVNGSMMSKTSKKGAWIAKCPSKAVLGISAHYSPFKHPHDNVIDLFTQKNRRYFRTDHHYHLTFSTNGTDLEVKYSHQEGIPV